MSLINDNKVAEYENMRAVFIQQITQHHKMFLRDAYAVTGNIVLAEDLLQETYLRAWSALNQVRDWQVFKAWIRTILRNECARFYAKKKYNLDVFDEETCVPAIELKYLEQECEKRAKVSVQKLPKIYRDPMWLFMQGHKCEDIAAHLQLNLNTVLTRLRRARGHLILRKHN